MFANYVDGRWRRPSSGRYLSRAATARCGPGGSVARSDARDVALAHGSALRAAGDWVRRGQAVRRAELAQLPGRIGAEAPALAMAEAWDACLPASDLDLGHAERRAADLRDLVRALPPVPVGRKRPPATSASPAAALLAHSADRPPPDIYRRLLPMLHDGRTAVVLLLYTDARRLPVGLLQQLGVMAAALPTGVLNIVTGLGLEAGVALVRQRCAPTSPAAIEVARPKVRSQ